MPSAPESEVWFDDYVRALGHDPGAPEPDLGIDKNPDRLITWNGHEVVCEIKQFESHPFARLREGGGVMDVKEVLGQVRRKISRAAEQLKPLAGTKRPLVVVLANPRGYPVSLSEHEMVWALYGDPVIRLTISTDTGAAVGPAEHTVGRNSRLLFNHQYLSAVVVLKRGSYLQDWHDVHWEQLKAQQSDLDPGDLDSTLSLATQLDEMQESAVASGEVEEGSYLFAEVFTAVSETAVPLPRDVFDGPRDSRWDYDAPTGSYTKTRGLRP